jgi:hypothetical protein
MDVPNPLKTDQTADGIVRRDLMPSCRKFSSWRDEKSHSAKDVGDGTVLRLDLMRARIASPKTAPPRSVLRAWRFIPAHSFFYGETRQASPPKAFLAFWGRNRVSTGCHAGSLTFRVIASREKPLHQRRFSRSGDGATLRLGITRPRASRQDTTAQTFFTKGFGVMLGRGVGRCFPKNRTSAREPSRRGKRLARLGASPPKERPCLPSIANLCPGIFW